MRARWRRSASAGRARWPLRCSATEGGDRVLAIVSVARGDRPFAPQERELFCLSHEPSRSFRGKRRSARDRAAQAVTDELTGLFNHRRFQEVMDAEVERARRYDQEMGLIMLDIDNFKRVNDTYGHMQGDMVLREVAGYSNNPHARSTSPPATAARRWRSRLPQTDRDGAAPLRGARAPARSPPCGCRGSTATGRPARHGQLRRRLRCPPAPDPTTGSRVAAADAALYRAKRSGKNRTVKAE